MSGIQQLLLGGSVQQAVDPYFYSVTSLLHGDGTNGGQNNTFLDSSTNNFTITRNGNTTQGSFSPFSQTGWSNYFDGSSGYLRNTSTSISDFGTGNFTAEVFVYKVTSAAGFVYDGRSTGGNGPNFQIYFDANNKVITVFNGATVFTSTIAVPLNKWTHVVICRGGTGSNQAAVFIDGIRSDLVTLSGTYTNGDNIIGAAAYTPLGAAVFPGYISNFRIVKGTDVYGYTNSTITVPTTPLTAISGTSLLTCQANRFLDASSNNYALTVSGSPSVQPFSPFNATTPYSTSSIGGSGYFDGSGDYLASPANSALALGTGDFTLECWVYATSTPSDVGIYEGRSNGNAGTVDGFTLIAFSGSVIRIYSNATLIASSGTSYVNVWCHVAVVRASGTWTLYINGVSQGTSTTSRDLTNNDALIGAGRYGVTGAATAYFPGYISNFRLVKGTAVYTANFTPPTAPLTAITNTSLLTNFTNGAIFDNAAVADYETVGNAQISTSVKKYGTGSMSFDGTGDRLVAAPIQTRAPGTGDFCYEFWFYANTSSNACLFDTRAVNNNTTGFACLLNGSSQIALYTNSTILTCGLALSASIWYHIAVTRTAGIIKIFVNGTVVGTLANTSNFSDRTLQLGQYIDSTGSLNGYIDDFRSSNGTGRYPYNFTPPTAEFPNIGGTVTLTADPYFDYTTLLLPGNGTNGAQNNTFLDSSTNNFTITRNGNTTQGTFSPFSQTGWGNYFNFATPDALRPSATGISNFGTGAFTVEFWISFQNTSPAGIYYGGTSGSIFIDYFSGSLRLGISGGSIPISYAFTPAVGIWYHVAFVRSSTTDTLYINGTSVATGSDSQNYPSDSGPYVGSWNGGTYTGAAYLSNVRVVKGTAVYTANFTPSTIPLTAISGTSLLTCQSNRFLDNSSNAFAITTSGSPSIQAFSPFNPTAAWSASTNGGSGYFDGSGDYLDFPTSSAFTMGTGDFTIELWYYPSVNYVSGNGYLFDLGSNGTRVQLFNNQIYFVPVAGSGVTGSAGVGVLAGTWYHIACVRSGSTITVYLNGTSIGSVSNSSNLTDNDCRIGEWGGGTAGPFNGYISSLRIVKGTAVYTAAFTPPTAPLTAITNTSLLCNYTNAGIYDATSKNDLETVGNAQISTTQSKFGGSSMYFDGTGDWLSMPDNPGLRMGAGDFTYECWLYPTSIPNVYQSFIEKRAPGAYAGVLLAIKSTGKYSILVANSSSSWGIVDETSVTASLNTWQHLAVVRYGNNFSVYLIAL